MIMLLLSAHKILKRLFNNRSMGFSLVELLVVISIIGVLSGVTISVINVAQQKRSAQNGIRKSNLEKIVQGIEAYYAAEGAYPANTSCPILPTYIGTWPTNNPANSQYYYYRDATNTELVVIIVPLCDIVTYPGAAPASGLCTRIAKYRSSVASNDGWGRIKECDYQASPTTDLSLCTNEIIY